MDPIKTNHPLALSFLFNEDIYVLNDDVSINNSTTENTSGTASIVEVPIQPLKTEKTAFEYIGENNKYILVIVNDANHKFINPKDQEFLLKILSAKKLDLNDIAIINTNNYDSVDFKDLKEYFAMSKLLTFGINPASLNTQGITPNKAGEYNGVKILGTWSLAQLDADVKKKTIYWTELKPF